MTLCIYRSPYKVFCTIRIYTVVIIHHMIKIMPAFLLPRHMFAIASDSIEETVAIFTSAYT